MYSSPSAVREISPKVWFTEREASPLESKVVQELSGITPWLANGLICIQVAGLSNATSTLFVSSFKI